MDQESLSLVVDGETKQITTLSSEKKSKYTQDSRIIPAEQVYKFPIISGPGFISNLEFTVLYGGARATNTLGKWVWKMLKGGRLLNQLSYKNISYLRNLKLRIFFDGKDKPCVDVPFADFFGAGFGRYRQFDSAYLGMTSGSFYCRFPMMFAKNCRIELENLNSEKITLYGEITYHKLENLPSGWAYFRSNYQSAKLTDKDPCIILETQGLGHYVGCSIAMRGEKILKHLSFLEGDVKIYVDGEAKPSLEYTGTEDYFMGGWYFIRGPFSASDHGCLEKSWLKRKILAYRFHPDKIPFQKSIKVTIDHGEFNEVDAAYSSVAYWYER